MGWEHDSQKLVSDTFKKKKMEPTKYNSTVLYLLCGYNIGKDCSECGLKLVCGRGPRRDGLVALVK